MRVSAAGDEIGTAVDHGLSQHAGIVGHRLGVFLEGGLQRLAEGHGLGGDHMLQWSALQAGEHDELNFLPRSSLRLRIMPPRGSAQRLVGGGRHHIGIFERFG